MDKKGKWLESFNFWTIVWGLGIAGQICWNMENQWFNTFVYAKIAKDPTIISWMVAVSATATTLSTFFFGCLSDRKGKRKIFVALGYILWGIFTICFGLTEFITKGSVSATSNIVLVAGIAVVAADAIMSFFGSMGNDAGFNVWINDHMNKNNRGQLGLALATQPVIGTIAGTVLGGMLVGKEDNYLRLFIVMGATVIAFGIYGLIFMKDSPELKGSKRGSFSKQFFSIFNFKEYFKLKELALVNLTVCIYFIAFNMYFTHLGNYMIYYLGFTPDMMGFIEGICLILAMVFCIPFTGLLNKGYASIISAGSIVITFVGVGMLGLFVNPETLDTQTIVNPILLVGVFLLGTGYVLFLQCMTVWGKPLYPQNARGQFEGIRILFFVLIPMVVGPLIANPIIKKNGEITDANGFVSYLPTNTLLIVGSLMVLLTFIPLAFATAAHKKAAK